MKTMDNSTNDYQNGGKRQLKTTSVKEFRRINNQMRREIDGPKEVYMEVKLWTLRAKKDILSCIRRHNN